MLKIKRLLKRFNFLFSYVEFFSFIKEIRFLLLVTIFSEIFCTFMYICMYGCVVCNVCIDCRRTH